MISVTKRSFVLLVAVLTASVLAQNQEIDDDDGSDDDVDPRESLEEQADALLRKLPSPSNSTERTTTTTTTTKRQCGPCQKESCVSPSDCVAGVVVDSCGCCLVCGRSEGELCDQTPEENKYGRCGENLDCMTRKDMLEPENICVCLIGRLVCGNDKNTYPTICALNEEATRRGNPDKFNPLLLMEHWGPCKEAPVIISPPRDSSGPLGADLTLNCEARGYPAPEISWKFVSAKGQTVSLPNDDQSVSIQMRGGPEPLMVTGWAQIMSLDPNYTGIYHCIATNTEGQVYAMASVGVYKNEL